MQIFNDMARYGAKGTLSAISGAASLGKYAASLSTAIVVPILAYDTYCTANKINWFFKETLASCNSSYPIIIILEKGPCFRSHFPHAYAAAFAQDALFAQALSVPILLVIGIVATLALRKVENKVNSAYQTL